MDGVFLPAEDPLENLQLFPRGGNLYTYVSQKQPVMSSRILFLMILKIWQCSVIEKRWKVTQKWAKLESAAHIPREAIHGWKDPWVWGCLALDSNSGSTIQLTVQLGASFV